MKKSKSYPRVGLVMGDPAGIGPEVLAGALKKIPKAQRARFILIGDGRLLDRYAGRGFCRSLGCVDTCKEAGLLTRPGKPTRAGARRALRWLETGVKLARKRELDALVTGPVSKDILCSAGFRFPGITEYLASRTKARKFAMLFLGGPFRVSLVTRHLPLKSVSSRLSKKTILENLTLTEYFLKSCLKIRKPRICVLGLNPHAGESGRMGREEKTVIQPTVSTAKRRGMRIDGPLSPDAAFWHIRKGKYDLVVAMYHDQALIPLKMLAFDRAVNVTVGLPFIRTSPDHGTAFELAGKGKADPRPMLESIKWALKLLQN